MSIATTQRLMVPTPPSMARRADPAALIPTPPGLSRPDFRPAEAAGIPRSRPHPPPRRFDQAAGGRSASSRPVNRHTPRPSRDRRTIAPSRPAPEPGFSACRTYRSPAARRSAPCLAGWTRSARPSRVLSGQAQLPVDLTGPLPVRRPPHAACRRDIRDIPRLVDVIGQRQRKALSPLPVRRCVQPPTSAAYSHRTDFIGHPAADAPCGSRPAARQTLRLSQGLRRIVHRAELIGHRL